MKTVFVLFDTLCRQALENYGCTTVETPNFKRFGEKAVTFDTHYVGSLPCIPARRDLHSGRLNFLHRSWGPLEPFDDSFVEYLRDAGVYTHLVTDHYHYWEDGGMTYHQRYASFDFIRGKARDKWKAMVRPPIDRFREMYHDKQFSLSREDGRLTNVLGMDGRLTNLINREFIKDEADFPCPRVYERAFEFLDINRDADDWFLHVECFDPHEPFHAPQRFRDKYPTGYQGPILDWPRSGAEVTETQEEIDEIQANYAALVSMCDFYFGKLLDYFDEHDMWDDTALLLITDHGFLLAEHDWWGKNRMPFYEGISHIPLVAYHPDFRAKGGERREALTQTIDIMPTVLDWYGVSPPAHVEGRSLTPLLETDGVIREAGLFGMFGAATNITDGRYTYFRYPPDMFAQELYEYTLMPTHAKAHFTPEELRNAELVDPFSFTKDVPVLRIPARKNLKGQPSGQAFEGGSFEDTKTVLYDLHNDPRQETPISDTEVEERLVRQMIELMRRNDAPREAFERLELTP